MGALSALEGAAQLERWGDRSADNLLREIETSKRRLQVRTDTRLTSAEEFANLVIRTSGEMRLSNFLLWQISYAEIWVTDRCWPEFDEATLHEAIRDFASRNRKYGGLNG